MSVAEIFFQTVLMLAGVLLSIFATELNPRSKRLLIVCAAALIATGSGWIGYELGKRSDSSPNPSPVADPCIGPEELAQQKGWSIISALPAPQSDSGLQVTINKPELLPLRWEALEHRSNRKEIHAYSEDRLMSIGRWTIYTPLDCRCDLGFQPCPRPQ